MTSIVGGAPLYYRTGTPTEEENKKITESLEDYPVCDSCDAVEDADKPFFVVIEIDYGAHDRLVGPGLRLVFTNIQLKDLPAAQSYCRYQGQITLLNANDVPPIHRLTFGQHVRPAVRTGIHTTAPRMAVTGSSPTLFCCGKRSDPEPALAQVLLSIIRTPVQVAGGDRDLAGAPSRN